MKKGPLKTFILCFLLAGIPVLIISMFYDGVFCLGGDFMAQQFEFYQHVHDAILSGNTMWDSQTDLGVNLIGSYSFYLIGSPFFWITLPFPSSAIPYLIGPLLTIKVALCGAFAHMFLSRYVNDQKYAMFGGIMYAFCSFTTVNMFYNHFHEAILIFPLLLYAFDRLMIDDQKGLFAIVLSFSAIMNYYFFVGQCVIIAIYFFVGLFTKRYKMTLRKFGIVAIESIVGTGLAMFILLPSFLAVIQVPRTSNSVGFSGFSALFYTPATYGTLFSSFFLPSAFQSSTAFAYEKGRLAWGSLGVWIPLAGCSGAIAYVMSNKKSWISKLLIFFVVFMFVPTLNSLFQMMHNDLYFRWTYAFSLIIILATVIAIERTDKNVWKKAWRINGCFMFSLIAFILFVPTNKDGEQYIGLTNFSFEILLYIFFAVVSFALMAIFVYKKIKFNTFMVFLCLVSSFYQFSMSMLISIPSMIQNDAFLKQIIIGRENFTPLSENNTDRYDTYKCLYNYGIAHNLPSTTSFHSILPGSVFDFYNAIENPRDVNMDSNEELYGLNALFSVKYIVTGINPDSEGEELKKESDFYNVLGGWKDKKPFYDKETGETIFKGYKYVDSQNDLYYFENENYVSMGFCFKYYITPDEFDEIPKEGKHLALTQALVVDEDTANKYSLEHISPSDLKFDYETYVSSCKELNNNSCDKIEYVNNGLCAEYSSDKTNLLFISVPYENGWTASANGKDVDIEKVSYGFIGIPVSSGNNEIKLKYNTPGLTSGCVVSVFCLLALACYSGIDLIKKKTKHKNKLKIERG